MSANLAIARKISIAPAAVSLLVALSGHALAEEGPGDCLGVDFDARKPITVSRIVAGERVNLIKSAFDDAACPSEAAACRGRSYLVKGDLVLTGKVNGPYVCVGYFPVKAPKQTYSTGWVAAASLAPVARKASPTPTDWLGRWEMRWQRGSGALEISRGRKGGFAMTGEAFYSAAQNVQTGNAEGSARQADGMLDFAEADDGCRVRMQRIDRYLLAEDNGACGGVAVSFTGLYSRK